MLRVYLEVDMLTFKTVEEVREWLRDQKEQAEKARDRVGNKAARSHQSGIAYGLGLALDALEGLGVKLERAEKSMPDESRRPDSEASAYSLPSLSPPYFLWVRTNSTSSWEKRDAYQDLEIAIEFGNEFLDQYGHLEFEVRDRSGEQVWHKKRLI
jgi:hypothetical protein